MITTIGAFVLAFGILLFLINVFVSLRNGQLAGPNPWDAPSLEWSTPSPPPPYNFPVIPRLRAAIRSGSRGLVQAEPRSELRRGLALDHGKEALATTALDAVPDAILKMPDDSPAPFIVTLAMSAGFVGPPPASLVARGDRRRSRRWRASSSGFGLNASLSNALERRHDRRVSTPRSSGRQHRTPRQRLVGHDDADRHRGRALRLSPVRLLLRGGSASAKLAAGGPAGLQAVASRHDHPALEQRGRLARRIFAEAGETERRRGGLSRRRSADGNRVHRHPGAGMGRPKPSPLSRARTGRSTTPSPAFT